MTIIRVDSSLGNPKLSIMIPVWDKRLRYFYPLLQKLCLQMHNLENPSDVEIIYEVDDGTENLGSKRQRLLNMSSGEFVCSIDDDDDIADDYLQSIMSAIYENPQVDAITFLMRKIDEADDPGHLIKFDLSKRYASGHKQRGVYTRHVSHITPLRRSKIVQVSFPEQDFGQDGEWIRSVLIDGLLKTQVFIDKELYLYHYYRGRNYQRDTKKVKPRAPARVKKEKITNLDTPKPISKAEDTELRIPEWKKQQQEIKKRQLEARKNNKVYAQAVDLKETCEQVLPEETPEPKVVEKPVPTKSKKRKRLVSGRLVTID